MASKKLQTTKYELWVEIKSLWFKKATIRSTNRTYKVLCQIRKDYEAIIDGRPFYVYKVLKSYPIPDDSYVPYQERISKPVIGFNIKGVEVYRFMSISEAERKTGFTQIKANIQGKHHTGNRFLWMTVKEFNSEYADHPLKLKARVKKEFALSKLKITT